MDGNTKKRTFDEMAAALAKLEAEAGQQLVMQRDLIHAKDRVDDELMRFKSIQGYISGALDVEIEEDFYQLTLEAVIEAFEFEIAMFFLPCDEPDCMRVAAQFGLDDVPETIAFERGWLAGQESQIIGKDGGALEAWADMGLDHAILCPFFGKSGEMAGLILGGISVDNAGFYEPITDKSVSAYTVMVQQVAAIWNTRQLTGEMRKQNAKLEVEMGKALLSQQDLIKTKDQVDDELMRFKSIQDFIAEALTTGTVDEFYVATLEAIIGAFELEVALFLRKDEETEKLVVAAEFGFEDAPGALDYEAAWFGADEGRIAGAGDGILAAWPGLNLDQAIICPFRDRDGDFAGVVLAGITTDSTDYYDAIKPELTAAFSVMVQQSGAMSITRELNEEIQRQNLRLVDLTSSYSRFVPFEFLELLERNSIEDIDAGDNASLDVSVLFFDIRGFTMLTEKLGPAPTFAWLNDVLSIMEPLIAAEHGFINQYQGDAIMALFPGPADGALRCAEAMMRAGMEFNARQQEAGGETVAFGLGINSGPLLLGAIGSENRLDSNVVGDTANLAARTESLTKHYRVPCIFTAHTHARTEAIGNHKVRDLDNVIVQGRESAVQIFELMLDARPAPEDFAAALDLYRRGEFNGAGDAFENYAAANPYDGAALVYLERCKAHAEMPPANWTGVTVMDEK
ncbi:MAG: adenylate/guanylate cyclase domain-containing protein [Rhodospirillaceae bacterium]|nr:adenylate/guanylate cyclase domain-containing protein [Rhodospirillaceae bacterium]